MAGSAQSALRGRRAVALVRALVVLVALVVGAAACGGSSKGHTAATSPGGGTTIPAASGDQSITIKNFAFTPTPISAKAGLAITITNDDTTDHTVTDGQGSFDTGHIAPGTKKTLTITTPGSYSYHCNIHQFMKGIIQVTA